MKRHLKYLIFFLGTLCGISIGCIIAGLWSSHRLAKIDDLQTQIDTLGRTHFIIGQQCTNNRSLTPLAPAAPSSINTSDAAPKAPATFQDLLSSEHGCLQQVFFSPDDDLESLLINLIAREQESIKIAVYSFTNGAIANALLQAYARGITIELIVDISAQKDKYNKIDLLQERGIIPFVYKPSTSSMLNDIMHNKFIIFGKNSGNRSLVWTGSFNFTKSAQLKNQENIVILDNQQLIEKYNRQFEIIKQRILTRPKIIAARAHKSRMIAAAA